MVNATRTTLSDVLWRWGRAIARACRRRHDGAVIPGRKRGLSPVIPARSVGWIAGALIAAMMVFAHHASAAPPNFQAAGNAVNGTGAVSPPWPGHAIGDIALLFIESAGGEPATLSTPAGFVAVTNSPQATGATTAGTRITVFWARATSASMAAPTVADPGDHVYARILTYRGVISTGDPWDVTGGGVKAAASTTVTVTGVTTTVADTLIVQAVARDNDSTAAAFSAQTNANLTSITERSDAGTTSGNGGGFAVWDGVKAAAGATGDTTATVTSSINAFLTIALKPPPPPATLSSAANQTFTVGDPPALASTLTVTDSSTPTITAAGDIRIRIPATFNMTWDTAVTTVTLGGGAAGKVSATLSAYEDSNKTAVLDVTSNFAASDQLTIAGLKFRDFTAASAADNLQLVVAGSGGATAATDDKTITIVDSGVKSAGSRILNDNAGRTPVAAEDVDVTSWDKNTKFLVTIGIQTGSSDACAGNQGASKLQWRNVTDAPGTWNTLGTAAGPEMILFNSANLVDDNALTLAEAQIVGTGPYGNGKEAENNNNKVWVKFDKGDHSAIQLAIDPAGGVIGKTYQFRFIVDTLCILAAGSNVMSVSVTLGSPAFAIGWFNAYEASTAAGAIIGVIKTKVAGASASVHMIAVNAARTAIQTSFTGTVRVEVLDASDNSGALDGDGCRSTWSVIQTLSPDPAFVAGDNGRKAISFTQANSYPNTRLRITYPAGAPTVTGCSTDNFAIRPNTFASFAVTDTDWQTAGTGRALNLLTFAATTPTHKAGQPFSVRATAVNAAGTPATTTNYTGAPTATLTACAGAACTATFGALTLATTFVAGQLASDVASYDNVGSFRLELVDSSFASVDAGDSSALEREIRSGTIDVGRFVPDHFAVALNAPVFGTACGAGSFTYIGQAFNFTTAPVITVTAQDFANNTTTLYAGVWLRITNASVTPATQAARYSRFDALGAGTTPALDPAGLPATAGDPAIGVFTNGVGALTFASGTGLGFVRSTTTPNAPFNADIALALNVIDTDGVVFASNPAAFGTATAGGGMAFSGGKGMRFGRLRLTNAFGSTVLDLPLSLSTQYYDGNFFVSNTADSCTTLLGSDLRFGFLGATPNLVACETAINPGGTIFFVGGKASATASPTLTPVKLAKPGSGNDGAVDITINLNGIAGNRCTAVGVAGPAATNANKPWLQGNWSGGAYTVDPTGRATFGIFKNADQFLYFREVY